MRRKRILMCGTAVLTIVGCQFLDSLPHGTDDRFERPIEARDIASDRLLERLLEYGFVVYAGLTPPPLEGVYHSIGGTTIFDQAQGGYGEHGTTCESYNTLRSTTHPYRYELGLEYTECEGGNSGIWAYASGFGDCFTLYSRQDGLFHGCSFTSVGVRSGCLDAHGIVDNQSAFLHTEQSGESCEELIANRRMPAPNEVRITANDFMERVSP